MMKYIQLFTLLALALIMSSCATILTGSTQRITIDSTPPGADIIIDGRIMGTTPAKVRLDKDINAFIDDGKDISLELEGYYSDGYILGTDIEPMTILNIFTVFGFAIDAVTGALMRYDSDYYNFRLISSHENTSYNAPLSVEPHDSSSLNNAEEDDYEKLMKLVDLYEEGLITEDEFEAEKAKIYEQKR